ncbi:hypothetical protein ig2599ANME_1193 [groundwater metagenome]
MCFTFSIMPGLYPGGTADLANLIHEQGEIADLVEELAYLVEVVRSLFSSLIFQ